jgi:hypothetical protein
LSTDVGGKGKTTEAEMLLDKLYEPHIEDLMCELLDITIDDYRSALEELSDD